MNEKLDASTESIERLLVQLNESENELRKLHSEFLALQEIVWKKRNKNPPSKDSNTKINDKQNLSLKNKESLNECDVKVSNVSMGGMTCNKLLKNKILHQKSLIDNIKGFKTETREKKKFIDGMQREIEQELFTQRKTSQIVSSFLNTFIL